MPSPPLYRQSSSTQVTRREGEKRQVPKWKVEALLCSVNLRLARMMSVRDSCLLPCMFIAASHPRLPVQTHSLLQKAWRISNVDCCCRVSSHGSREGPWPVCQSLQLHLPSRPFAPAAETRQHQFAIQNTLFELPIVIVAFYLVS